MKVIHVDEQFKWPEEHKMKESSFPLSLPLVVYPYSQPPQYFLKFTLVYSLAVPVWVSTCCVFRMEDVVPISVPLSVCPGEARQQEVHVGPGTGYSGCQS
jgi:hypothetical protein